VARVRLPNRTIDVLLAAVLTGLTLATLMSRDAGWVAGLLAVLTVAPIALRQRAPVLTMLVILAGLAAYSLVVEADFPNGGVGVLVAMFTVATLRSRAIAAVMFLAAIAVTAFAYPKTGPAAPWPELAQAVLIVLGAWVLGEGTRRWAERAERLAAEAARAVADERVRIARELHDIVAHHMSVISLQAGLAEYVLDVDLPTARTAIGNVGEAGREALLDMRRMLDVLRVDRDEEPDLGPQPGLDMLEDLVSRTRNAGLAVDVTVTGERRALPPGLDLCAYRVVQESLTNVLKHAGPARARVDVDFGDRTLTVRIRNDGAARAPRESPTSHGIRGMRERAELYGGVLTAGPAADGGFAVVARLPLEVVA
jgi:signal transduction histidine kinase